MTSSAPILGVIGGSGLYHMPDLEDTEEFDIHTPYGKPSAPVVVGALDGRRIAFLARHGLGHTIMPSQVNYRANLYALKVLGVRRVVSVNACGSLREDFAPGHIVIPDQIFDHTLSRPRTFFGDGLTVHVSVADPFCPDLSAQLFDACQRAGAQVHAGGNFIIIEGPRFSTRLESNVFRTWGMTLIGMTTCPEAFLAREAELCYAVMAHVTDFDSWHTSEQPVTVEMVIQTLNRNTQVAQQAIRNLARTLGDNSDATEPACACQHALADALITLPVHIPAETRQRTALFVDKYLKS
jgi:5'-methylthioadenosine phosphorylase